MCFNVWPSWVMRHHHPRSIVSPIGPDRQHKNLVLSQQNEKFLFQQSRKFLFKTGKLAG